MTRLVATWKHRGGSTVTLENGGPSKNGGFAYFVTGDRCGGTFYQPGDQEAIGFCEYRIREGYYSRDAWKTGYVFQGVR